MNRNDGEPGGLAGWEGQQQAKFDRQQKEAKIRAAEFAARNVQVESPQGQQYVVRAVRRGESLRQVSGISGLNPLADLAGVLFAITSLFFRRESTRWTVGVVRPSKVIEEKVVWKEQLPPGADEKARVAEVAEAVRDGHFDNRSQ